MWTHDYDTNIPRIILCIRVIRNENRSNFHGDWQEDWQRDVFVWTFLYYSNISLGLIHPLFAKSCTCGLSRQLDKSSTLAPTLPTHSKDMLYLVIWLDAKRKRKWSDSVLWQKPLYLQKKIQQASWQHRTTPTKTSIAQRLRTDLGRSIGLTAVNPTGVVKPLYYRSTFPLTATAV